MDIDQLTGYELNCAVARHLGWKQDDRKTAWWTTPTGERRIIRVQPTDAVTAIDFDPARSFGDAWALDGGGVWIVGRRDDVIIVAQVRIENRIFEAVVIPSDFSTKLEALATALCRVWLKAMGNE